MARLPCLPPVPVAALATAIMALAALGGAGCARIWGIEDVTCVDGGAVAADAGSHAPDADPHAPDADPHAPDAAPRPDADPRAPDANPAAPDASPATPDAASQPDAATCTGSYTGPETCPSDMAFARAACTCIDRYEASIASGSTQSVSGATPEVAITPADAKVACASAGKYLCHGWEWKAACNSGNDAQLYPYGATYAAGYCNGAGSSMSFTPTGSYASCEGGYPGIWDMSGNVAEWTDDPNAGGFPARGGSHTATGDWDMKCSHELWMSASTESTSIGFRCCRLPTL